MSMTWSGASQNGFLTPNSFQVYGKSGNVTDELLKDLPPGVTLRVKILALNGSLEALDGPVAEILVG